MKPTDIYNPAFVKDLFSEMSKTYGLTNLISSFGFCQKWRAQCVNQISFRDGTTIYDFMSGMGECWNHIEKKLNDGSQLVAVDFCPAMCRKAKENSLGVKRLNVQVSEQDILANDLEDNSADYIISTFGLKTFSDEQKKALAAEIERTLKPRGAFSLLEISVPPGRLLRLPYMFYLRYVIPLIGKLFMGNPDNYRMLGIYTEEFKDCSRMADFLKATGLEVEYRPFFFGCAGCLVGRKS